MTVLVAAVVLATTGCSAGAGAAQAPAATTQLGAAPESTAQAADTAPASMVRSTPSRVRIPAIGVDSELMALGLRTDGSLEVPPAGFPAGWYTGAPTPGELGPAIIAGHVDWDGAPGVFFDLGDLAPQDEIVVDREDGTAARFQVTSVQQFPKDSFPTDAVYADLDHAGLRLITCGGSFDGQARSYRDNVVVFAELVGTG
jgi:sortase (surface protein transpeptidase)